MPATIGRRYTLEEFEKIDGDYELDEGLLVPVSYAKRSHCKAVTKVAHVLFSFVEPRGLGEVLAGDAGFCVQRDPDTMRGIDVAFVRKDRLPPEDEDVILEGIPDLAVEIRSGGDRPGQLNRKVSQYLHAGCPLVWVLNPRKLSARVHRPGAPVRVLGPEEILDGGDVLPGFRIVVRELFR